MSEDRYGWEFVGFAVDISGKPTIRLYAHRAHAACSAIVAEDHLTSHEYWCEDVIRR